jgi:DEAD/DEAH box helicase domain-containing protein
MQDNERIVVLDVETQKSADEVGGWGNARAMRLSVGVAWSYADSAFHRYDEQSVNDLITEIKGASPVVGYNLLRFDYQVLSAYTREPLDRLPTIDMLAIIHRGLGFRLKLDDVAQATLGTRKSADGLQAIHWWRTGDLDKLFEYCELDVDITRRLFEFGRKQGHIRYRDKYKGLQNVRVRW